jgi:pyruvate,orthophosphate dikinase
VASAQSKVLAWRDDRAGIRVPPGFTISTEACLAYFAAGNRYPEGLWEEVLTALRRVERAAGATFGDRRQPLLLSVRSGARVSMPGMMDTVLNIGLNDSTVQGLIQTSNNPRFAYDSYRRFITMFGNVVMGVPHHAFEKLLADAKQDETSSDSDQRRSLGDVRPAKALVQERRACLPSNPRSTAYGINAVFASWHNDRAVAYRRENSIPKMGGGERTSHGVWQSRRRFWHWGCLRVIRRLEKIFYGEFLSNAQGEDVVAGIRDPQPIHALEELLPEVYTELVNVCQTLEAHFRDMQDIEFTIQAGTLYLLQTRSGKRTAPAAVRTAVEMALGLITSAGGVACGSGSS